MRQTGFTLMDLLLVLVVLAVLAALYTINVAMYSEHANAKVQACRATSALCVPEEP